MDCGPPHVRCRAMSSPNEAHSSADGTPPQPDSAPPQPDPAPPQPDPAPPQPAEPAGKPAAEKAFPPVPPDRLSGAVEALLLASGDVLTVERIRDLLGLASVIHVREALEEIRTRWQEAGLAVEVDELAGGVRVATRPEYAEYVRRLSRRPEVDRLTPSLLETLSIVAYRQPVPRVEVERIRGVQCGDGLRGLLERRLVKVTGRSDQPGRPLLYGTTRRFLEIFGLRSLQDLPEKGDLKRL